jgi:hypothetical protein
MQRLLPRVEHDVSLQALDQVAKLLHRIGRFGSRRSPAKRGDDLVHLPERLPIFNSGAKIRWRRRPYCDRAPVERVKATFLDS